MVYYFLELFLMISTCDFALQVLNEVVVDRGPSSYLTNLEIYCNDHHITSVQGDGKMLSLHTHLVLSFMFSDRQCTKVYCILISKSFERNHAD